MFKISPLRHIEAFDINSPCNSYILKCAEKLCDLETCHLGLSKEVAQGSNAGSHHPEEGWMQQWMTAFNIMHFIRHRVYGLASEAVVSASTSSDILGTCIKIVRFLDKPVHPAFIYALLYFL